ncbi:restriction endonuclease subunit S [Bacillus cereus]|nr:restriction endonuclease subunit S [Bacillus cereus]
MKNNYTPEIRFAGYTENWEQRNWEETVNISTNMVDPKTGSYDELPHIGPGNIESFTGKILDNVLKVKDSNLISGKFHFYRGDIIYGKINPQLGKYAIAPFEGLASADSYILNTKNGVVQNFLYSVLQTKDFYKYSVSVSARTGMPKINRDELNVYNYKAPKTEEQTKVGNFFVELEHLISLHQQELTILKQTKQGFLQKMFPKEGESVPEVRFPGFTGDWEQRNLGDCISYIKGFAFKSEDYRSDGIRLVRVSDLSSNEIKLDNEKIFLDREYENDYKKYKLNVGDIIITTVGSKVELKESAVGRPIIVNKENEGLLNQNSVKISPLNGYNSYFIYGNLLQERYMNYIGTIERGNANQANIAISDLWLYKVYLTSNEEQKQIGNFFRQLDDTIALHQRELDALKETKKAFLQKMFA